MFVMYDKEKMNVPVKVWLEDQTQLEEKCYNQAINLSQLPFVHKWVALMPDAHAGMGMPIGGVLPTINVVVPNAVGVDIGCGMGFVGTNIPAKLLKETQTENGSLLQCIIGDIMRNIPVGFGRHKEPQPSYVMDVARENLDLYEVDTELLGLFEAGYYQVGTLGGGNHFIELQEDQQGNVGIMVHSGSRNFGKQVCDYFNNKAKELNLKWHSSVLPESRLAFLPVDTPEGQQYIRWMNLALDYAYENREKMLWKVRNILEKWIGKFTDFSPEYDAMINCHHNYASLEHHYGKNVWVHRKGATRAREGDLAVIPGAMGSYSYVVMGLGNPESFHSCSHGAGRRYSRTGAMKEFTVQEVMEDLKEQEVILGKHGKEDIPEESRFAYKDIQEVMRNQTDLVHIVKELKTLGVVKG